MTQHNASMVEESSAAAAELREQADRLGALVGAFKLSNTNEQATLNQAARAPAAKKPLSAAPRRLEKSQEPEWESF